MNMNLNKREIKEDAAPGKSLKKEQKKRA